MDGDQADDPAMRGHLANMAVLRRISGVTRVGFGLKESGGEIVPEWAYRVYVRRKRLTSELPPEDVIPPRIGGFKTDVLIGVPGDTRPESARSLGPGDSITREVSNASTETGTVGILVRKDSSRFLLTAAHVLDDRRMLAEGSKDIYSPRIKTIAGARCNKPSAHITAPHGVKDHVAFEDKKFYVDATIAPLYDGVKGSNVLPGVGPLDQGLRDIANVAVVGSAPAEEIRVTKVGGTTGLTRGTVVELFHDVTVPGPPPETFAAWEFVVRADVAHSWSYKKEVQLAPDQDLDDIRHFFTGQTVSAEISGEPGHQTLRLSGQVYSLVGDSGSCVVDEGRRIVGLHTAGQVISVRIVEGGSTTSVNLPNGRGVTSYIRPVFHEMGLSEATGVIPPGSLTSGAAVAPPEARWEEAPEPPVLEDLDAMLTRTPAGRRLRTFAGRHGEEIAHLVHERRRVLVVWHRAQGPGYAAAFLRALREPEGRLPQEIGGVRLVDTLSRMRDVLLLEGDEELRQAIGDHGDLIVALAERATSIPELRAALAEADG